MLNGRFMRIFKLSVIFAGLVLFVFGCAGSGPAPLNSAGNNTNTTAASPQPTADEFASSRKFYLGSCAKCHRENGEGGEVNIEGRTFKAPSFKRPSMIKDPDSELIEHIAKGGDDMPPFKDRLSPDQIKDLVRFIRHEFQGK